MVGRLKQTCQRNPLLQAFSRFERSSRVASKECPPKLKEVILHPHSLHPQQRLPDLGELKFQTWSRGGQITVLSEVCLTPTVLAALADPLCRWLSAASLSKRTKTAGTMYSGTWLFKKFLSSVTDARCSVDGEVSDKPLLIGRLPGRSRRPAPPTSAGTRQLRSPPVRSGTPEA